MYALSAIQEDMCLLGCCPKQIRSNLAGKEVVVGFDGEVEEAGGGRVGARPRKGEADVERKFKKEV